MFYPLPHLITNNFVKKMTKTWCVGGKRYSNTNIIEYEKVNPRTKKLVKVVKGKCDICGRNKSQIFTR